MSNAAVLKKLGMQLKQMRLNKNLTQGELGGLSGVSRSAISEMENNGNGTLNTFIQLLRALEKLEILNHFITEAPLSPLQIARLHGKKRQRASGRRGMKNDGEDSAW